MAEAERFRRLEPDEPPASPRGPGGVSDRRFAHLEVGETAVTPSRAPEDPTPPAAPASPDAPPAAPVASEPVGPSRPAHGPLGLIEDRHVSITFSPRAGAPDHVTLVLNGRPYASDEPDLPEDLRLLIDRILEDGYSPALLDMWQGWRARRRRLRRDEPESERERLEWEIQALDEQARQRREELTDWAIWLGVRGIPVILALMLYLVLRAVWR